ncbi:MAG: polyketide synthase dehydratase domain-containing protein, partial [Holophagales bacterium]|nr:polyketide synthase dehydratase domain-containing protein [Holophagales bacterium]
DYSAANDFLCKATSHLRRARPETFGLAIDWTAWGEIGMASRGSIPVMMERAGIGMLPPRAGLAVVRQELTAPARDGGRELVVATELGGMLEERHPTGGLDPEALAAHGEDRPRGPICGKVLSMGVLTGLVVETELDPTEQPFLFDHRIDGVAVLPGVMGMEAFAEAARLLFPDRHVTAIEDVSFEMPFKFYRDEPRSVRVEARYRLDGDDVLADCRLLGARALHGRSEPQVTEHFTGRVRLTVEPPAEEKLELDLAEDGLPSVAAEPVYRLYFHGPAYQVVESAWRQDGRIAGRLPSELPPNHRPEELPLFAAPRLVELCFQTAGLGEMGTTGAMGLPQKLGRLAFGPGAGEAAQGPLTAVVDEAGGRARVASADGIVLLTLEGYRTIALPGAVDAEAVRPLREVFA